jgi:two-component system cell cycle sensor histidine kinase/response regulator CckA
LRKTAGLNRFRDLLESAGFAVWAAEARTLRYTYVSRQVEALLGYGVEAWLAEPEFWRERVHPEDRERVWTARRDQVAAGQDHQLEYRMVRADGGTAWVRETVQVAEGIARGILVDISERTRLETSLRESEERYRALFDSNPQPMWIYDRETLQFLAVNEAAVRHYGYSRDEFLAMTVKDVRPPEDVPRFLEFVAKLEAEFSGPSFWRHRRKNGQVIQTEVFQRSLRFGERPARLVLASDVTEKQRLEEEVRNSQKVEAVGQMAGSVAHDFNNLLTAIAGYSDLLLASLEPEDARRADVEEIRKAAERAARLTRQLLAFSRKQAPQPRVLDLNQVVLDMENILARLLGKGVRLASLAEASPARVKADAAQLEQVLLNLAMNARDAMPRGGLLTLCTSSVDVAGEPYVVLEVIDTGIGMDAETQARLFEPFFTTEGQGQGTGLGLSTVHGIVRQCGGRLEVWSEPGQGSTFRIYLPLAEEDG